MHTNLFIYYSSRQLNRLLRTSVFHHKVFQDEIISAPLPKICGFVFLRRISLKTLITSQKPGAWKTKCKSAFQWEGIKGLILRHCGKLNSTHPGELQQPQIVHCGCRNAQAAMHKMNYIPSNMGCNLYMATDLGPVRATCKKKYTFKYEGNYRNARAAPIHKMECSSSRALRRRRSRRWRAVI